MQLYTAKHHWIDLLQIRVVGGAVMECSFFAVVVQECLWWVRSAILVVQWKGRRTECEADYRKISAVFEWQTEKKMKFCVQGCASSGQRGQMYPKVITLTRRTFSFKGKNIRWFRGDTSWIAGDAWPVPRNKSYNYDLNRRRGTGTGL
jgi:hypothetical protein